MKFAIRVSLAALTLYIAADSIAAGETLPRGGCEGWAKAAVLTVHGTINSGGLTASFLEAVDLKNGRHVIRQEHGAFAEGEGSTAISHGRRIGPAVRTFLDSNWAAAIAATEIGCGGAVGAIRMQAW
jgi:hypothetical protein